MDIARRSLLAAMGAAPFASLAEQWPARASTVVVGFPAGQTTDIVARAFADELSRSLGQPFIVDNKPGAGSMLAAQTVTRAKPDGHTLLWGGSGNLGIAPNLYRNANYDPVKDLDAITMGGVAPMFLLVRADSKFARLEDLLKAARVENIDYGSGGTGVTNHLGMELLRLMTETKLTHIPYKGSVPAMTDLMGGQIQVMFDSIPSSNAQLRSGKLRALAVSAQKRLPNFPDIPAVAETVPGYECVAWTALCGPAGTPLAVKNLLSKELLAAMQRETLKSRLEALGNYVDPGMSMQRTAQWIASEGAKFRKILQAANITV
jgi:tripartite-type tricarboxylate transporter receptor subunit TctC